MSSRPGREPALGLQHCQRNRPHTHNKVKEMEPGPRQGRLLRIGRNVLYDTTRNVHQHVRLYLVLKTCFAQILLK